MKQLFPGQYRPSDEELTKLWEHGTFVFDTNVLLNLYSYPESLREIFVSVLEKICGRSWIPYHVALEFHRNRFSRIKQANTPLLNLRDRIRTTSEELEGEIKEIEFEKRNTGVDNLEERLLAVKQATSLLAEALDKACERLPKIGLDDPIAQRLSTLFEKNVGAPPKDQTTLDLMLQDGSDRYEKKIPPGFRDAKDKKDIKYYDREITYPAMFGDLIVWRQTVKHSKENGLKDVLFITGDRKEDWWHIVEGKTLGPLPDLIREFLEKTGAERFWMYTADQFLKYAETYLSAKEVTPETIEQVREISAQNEDKLKFQNYWKELPSFEHVLPKHVFEKNEDSALIFSHEEYNRLREVSGAPSSQAERIFSEWLKRHHETKDLIYSTFPDIVVPTSEGIFGYEIFSTSAGLRGMVKRISDAADRASALPFEVTMVVILMSDTADGTIDNFLGKLGLVLEQSSVRKVIVGDIFLHEFNVRQILRMPPL
jgi:hypothetical protein